MTRLGFAIVLCLSVVGCGVGSGAADHTIANGSVTAGCSAAIRGAGSNEWRSLATAAGRFGVYGSGRDFRTAQKARLADFPGLGARGVPGPILVTKTPLVVDGKQPLELAIAPNDRERAGLVVAPFGGGPYAKVRLVPCRDQPRTFWAAGWVLRDPDRVTVVISQENGPASRLVVGRTK